jgi:glutathione peroxidase
MSPRQKILKAGYDLIMFFKKIQGRRRGKFLNKETKNPIISFFDLKAIAMNGKEVSMKEYAGKKIMVVNVASNCGFTGQYDELEKIYLENKEKLVILGFPANDFHEQESGSDSDIEQFCRINYGVTFPLFKKQSVVKPGQQEIFDWLSHKEKNGWNDQQPTWNFCKYIVDENGILTGFYESAISPLSEEITQALK